MNMILEDTCQALTEVLQDCGKSLESNLVGINKIVEYEQEGDHVFNEHVHDMVDTICEDIDDNLVSLAELTNSRLEKYLGGWKYSSRSAQFHPLLTTFSPGDRVVVGLTESSPHYIENIVTGRGSSKSLSKTIDDIWEGECLPTFVADQYVSGCVVSMTSNVYDMPTNGMVATIRLDSETRKNKVISVPIDCIYPYVTSYSTGAEFVSSTPSYQVGQLLLIACHSDCGVYQPVRVMEVNHQYDLKSTNSNSKKSSSKSVKEISVQFRNNFVERILVENIDLVHSCHSFVSKRKCNGESILILDDAWSATSLSTLYSLGFLLRQFPDFLLHFILEKLHGRCGDIEHSTIFKSLNDSIHRRWLTSLQNAFYRRDRENVANNDITRGNYQLTASLSYDSCTSGGPAGQKRNDVSCELKELTGIARDEIKRVYEKIFPPTNSDNDSIKVAHSSSQSPPRTPPPSSTDKLIAVNGGKVTQHQIGKRLSATTQNLQMIKLSEISSRGDGIKLLVCRDVFTYSSSSVMPFACDDVPKVLGIASTTSFFETLMDKMTLSKHIRHVCRLFDSLFCLGIILLDSIHHHTYQNDFLYSTAEIEMKNIRDAHLSRWFSSCENDDDGGKSTMADYDLDDKAYFSDDSNTDMESKRNSVSRRRSNSDESCNSTKRIRSTSNCPPPEKELHRGNASNKVPKLNFEEISQEDEASTGVSMSITREKDTDSDVLGGSSRLLKLLESISFLSNNFLLKIVGELPAPFEVDAHEWGMTFAVVLNCRNSLLSLISKIDLWHTSFSATYQRKAQVLATFDNTLQPVEGMLLQVAAEFHEMIPLKVDEAVGYVHQTWESTVTSSLWREDWDATSPYKKGKKVSAGVLSLISMCKSLIHSFGQALPAHSSILQRLCASIVTVSIRTILNAYCAITPSRVRQGQMQKDLTAALSSVADIIQSLIKKGLLPKENEESCNSAQESNRYSNSNDFYYLPVLHQSQRAAFFLESEEKFKNHILLQQAFSSYCRKTILLRDGGQDYLPDTLSAMHVDDYGFGDTDFQYMTFLKDQLLELIFVTHICTAPSSSIRRIISKLCDNRKKPSLESKRSVPVKQSVKNREFRRSSGGLEMFDNYYNSYSDSIGYPESLLVLKPLLVQGSVALNPNILEASATSLRTILNFILINKGNVEAKSENSFMNSEQESGTPFLFDAAQELRFSHGGMDSKTGELFCVIDVKVFSLMAVKAFFLLTILSQHRPELIQASYPALTDEEIDTKEFLETFISSFDSEMELYQASMDKSTAIVEQIIDLFTLMGDDNTKEESERSKVNYNGTIDEVQIQEIYELEFHWEE